jgi:hypothetical protein
MLGAIARHALTPDDKNITDRKLRLLICAFCRAGWNRLSEPCRASLEVAERFADEQASVDELTSARNAVDPDIFGEAEAAAFEEAVSQALAARVTLQLAMAAAMSASDAQAYVARPFVLGTLTTVDYGRRRKHKRLQAHLLRDIIGNPHHQPEFDSTWRSSTSARLAADAYAERVLPHGHLVPARLAVLADALEESGCICSELLSHLRSPGPHVRGCWALDLALGKN